MTVKKKRCYGLVMVLLLLGVALAGWTPAVAPTGLPAITPVPMPSLGDTWTRPADGMEMAYVPAGQFRMGSTDEQVERALEVCDRYIGDCEREWFEDEQSMHTVALDEFWIDRTEVTNVQYRHCVEAGVCDAPLFEDDDSLNGAGQPVVGVDWTNAQGYCEWVGARLPTEAEWEYAARGPESLVYPWGDTFEGTRCNFCDRHCERDWADKSIDDGYEYPAPVGSYPGGAGWVGALDMAGNAWEWVAPSYSADYYGRSPRRNPTGPPSGDVKVLRGGSWNISSNYVRSAGRDGGNQVRRADFLGFRCANGS